MAQARRLQLNWWCYDSHVSSHLESAWLPRSVVVSSGSTVAFGVLVGSSLIGSSAPDESFDVMGFGPGDGETRGGVEIPASELPDELDAYTLAREVKIKRQRSARHRWTIVGDESTTTLRAQ